MNGSPCNTSVVRVRAGITKEQNFEMLSKKLLMAIAIAVNVSAV